MKILGLLILFTASTLAQFTTPEVTVLKAVARSAVAHQAALDSLTAIEKGCQDSLSIVQDQRDSLANAASDFKEQKVNRAQVGASIIETLSPTNRLKILQYLDAITALDAQLGDLRDRLAAIRQQKNRYQ